MSPAERREDEAGMSEGCEGDEAGDGAETGEADVVANPSPDRAELLSRADPTPGLVPLDDPLSRSSLDDLFLPNEMDLNRPAVLDLACPAVVLPSLLDSRERCLPRPTVRPTGLRGGPTRLAPLTYACSGASETADMLRPDDPAAGEDA